MKDCEFKSWFCNQFFLPAQFVTSDFPDIQFSPENHGVQVIIKGQNARMGKFWQSYTKQLISLWQIFVSTLPATQVELKKDDISWVTQLTTDRLDIFAQVCALNQIPNNSIDCIPCF